MSYWQIDEGTLYSLVGIEPGLEYFEADQMPQGLATDYDARELFYNTLEENLGEVESAAERVLDDIRRVAKNLIDDYITSKGASAEDARHLNWYKNMADDFAHETFFGLRGGVPEYNEIHFTYLPDMLRWLEVDEDDGFFEFASNKAYEVGAETWEDWVDPTVKEVWQKAKEAVTESMNSPKYWNEDQWKQAMDNGVVLYYEPYNETYTVYKEGVQVEDGLTSYKKAEQLAAQLIGEKNPEGLVFYYNEEGTDVAQDYYQEYEKQFVWSPTPKTDPRQETLKFSSAVKKNAESPYDENPSEVQEAVRKIVDAYLSQRVESAYYNWFDSAAGDHYARDFDSYLNSWYNNIAEVVTWAEVSGTGDITALDYHDYPRELAAILFKLNPNWETESEDDIYNQLKDWELDVIDPASQKAATELQKQQRTPFEASAASYRGTPVRHTAIRTQQAMPLPPIKREIPSWLREQLEKEFGDKN